MAWFSYQPLLWNLGTINLQLSSKVAIAKIVQSSNFKFVLQILI